MAKATAKTATKQRQGFQPGKSGNPKGRPHGSRNRASLAVEALLNGEAEALSRRAVELALAGDIAALRLCFDRICPPRRSRPVKIELPEVNTAADLAAGQSAVIGAVSRGDLSPDEGLTVA